MSENLQSQTHLHFSQRDTEELLRIWSENDRFEWSEMTFDVIGEILQERGVDPPPQGKPVYEAHKLKSAVVREAPQEPHGAPPAEDEAAHEVYETRGAVSDRPKTVIHAVYLALGALVIGAALAVVNLATGRFKALAKYPQFGAIVGLIAVGYLGLDAFLLYGTWRGRNVARILYVGLTLLSAASTLTSGGWDRGFRHAATQSRPVRLAAVPGPGCSDTPCLARLERLVSRVEGIEGG